MNWPRSISGGVLSSIYLILAGYVAQDEIRNSGGGGWITLRGMGTFILTAPSQLVFGNLLPLLGVPRISYSNLGLLGYSQIILHLLFTALVVYFLGFGIEWIVRRFMVHG